MRLDDGTATTPAWVLLSRRYVGIQISVPWVWGRVGFGIALRGPEHCWRVSQWREEHVS